MFNQLNLSGGYQPPTEGFSKAQAIEDGIERASGPFTDPVAYTLGYLKRAVEDVSAVDEDLGSTLSDIADDLARFMEDQIMLMFKNWEVEQVRRDDMLVEQHNKVYATIGKQQALPSALLRMAAETPSPQKSASGDGTIASTVVEDGQRQQHHHHQSEQPQRAVQVKPARGEQDPAKQVSCGLYLIMEALQAKLQAEAAVAHYHVKSNNTLFTLASAPNHKPHTRSIPAHSGVAGAVFSSGIAINLPDMDDETRAMYYKDAHGKKHDADYGVDEHRAPVVDNVLAFPVWSAGKVVGVVEVINKRQGNRAWNGADEGFVYAAAQLVSHLFSYCTANVVNLAPFSPQQLRSVRPLTNLQEVGLDVTDLELKSLVSQLILRADEVHTQLSKDGEKLKEKTAGVSLTSNLKEVHAYMQNLEDSYRNGLNSVVVADREVLSLQDELSKRNQRIRILEENLNYVNEQLVALKSRSSKSEQPVAGHEYNTRNYSNETLALGTTQQGTLVRSPRSGGKHVQVTSPRQQQQLQKQLSNASLSRSSGGGVGGGLSNRTLEGAVSFVAAANAAMLTVSRMGTRKVLAPIDGSPSQAVHQNHYQRHRMSISSRTPVVGGSLTKSLGSLYKKHRMN
eukprot:PhM_4_TR16508/c0_g1_i1/m.36533